MAIYILNKHFPIPEGVDQLVTVMRPSVLGNPYPIRAGDPESTREKVIAKFKSHLSKHMLENSEIRKEVMRIAELHRSGASVGLLCCCAPSACHADVIRDVCLELSDKPNNLESKPRTVRPRILF